MSMTESENILLDYYEAKVANCLKECDGCCHLCNEGECECVDANVIDHLRELQAYRAIGTVSEFRELKEKATEKSPAYQGEHEKCPTCGSFCIGEYCIKCGQRILYD